MIQYPKQEHVTLPSVEAGLGSLNILKDPPKSIWTRQINKVGSSSQILEEIGEDGGDRISEYIKVYPRGINPMVSVSYSNYGTNGGQYRGVTNAGLFGSNKMATDGRSAYLGQAKLPYAALRDGAFRPPVFRQEDLVPLSRLPRTNTSAWTAPGFVSYAQDLTCGKQRDPEKMKEIKKEAAIIRGSVRPTKVVTLARPARVKESFELREVIDNPIHISEISQLYGADRGEHRNPENISGRLQDALYAPYSTNPGAPGRGGKVQRVVGTAKFVGPVSYKSVSAGRSRPGGGGAERADRSARVLDVSYKEVASAQTAYRTAGVQPAERGEHRMAQVSYKEVAAARTSARTAGVQPAERGKHRMNELSYQDVRTQRSSHRLAGVQPAERGKHRMNELSYQDISAPKSSRILHVVEPAEVGAYMMNELTYQDVSAARSSFRTLTMVEPEVENPKHLVAQPLYSAVESQRSERRTHVVTPAEKGSHRTNELVHQDVKSTASRGGAQTLQPVERGEHRMNELSYQEVDAAKSSSVAMLASDAPETKDAVHDELQHHSEESRAAMPGAVQTSAGSVDELRRSIPQHERNSRKISRETVTRAVEPKLKELERKTPLTEVVMPTGVNYGGDAYTATAREKKIKATLSVKGGFEGKATVPVIGHDREGVAERDPTKRVMLQKAHAEARARGL